MEIGIIFNDPPQLPEYFQSCHPRLRMHSLYYYAVNLTPTARDTLRKPWAPLRKMPPDSAPWWRLCQLTF